MQTPESVNPNDPHIADEDKMPEAPQPTPRREIFMKVQENGAAHDYEGGTVILVAIHGQHTDELVDARLVISAKDNALLHQFPWKYQSSKAKRFYRITIDEVDFHDLPPRPQPRARDIPVAAPVAPPAVAASTK